MYLVFSLGFFFFLDVIQYCAIPYISIASCCPIQSNA